MQRKFHIYILKSDRLSAVSLYTEINTVILKEIRQVSKCTILLENKNVLFSCDLVNNRREGWNIT